MFLKHVKQLVVCTQYQLASSTPRWQLWNITVLIIHILLLLRGRSSDNTAPSYHLHDFIAGKVSACTYEVKNNTKFLWASLSWQQPTNAFWMLKMTFNFTVHVKQQFYLRPCEKRGILCGNSHENSLLINTTMCTSLTPDFHPNRTTDMIRTDKFNYNPK